MSYVPTLRFPEFSEEWKAHPLTDFLEFKNGLNPEAKRFGKGVKFISVMDILNNPYITYDVVRSSVEAHEKDMEEFSVNYGDILFQRSSETLEDIGRSNVYLDDNPCLFGGFVIRGKKIGDYNPVFFKHLLDSPFARKKIIVKGAGAQHFNVGQEGLSKVSLRFPDRTEQDKIAKVFRKLDERIKTQIRVIEDYKRLKSGVIKLLYDVGGESYLYKDILSVITEKNKDLAYTNVLSASQELGMVNRDELNLDIQFDHNAIVGYKIVRRGDYVLHLRSFQGGLAFSETEGICSPAYTILRPNHLIVYGYLREFFMSQKFIDSLRLVIYGIRDGRSINVDEFLHMKITIPPIEKQKDIALRLEAFSQKICLEENILEKLQAQKNYLLSQMFI